MPFSYANPHHDVEPGIVRDPFIIRVGETYYLTGTLRPIWAGPNPGVPLWSSPEIHHAGEWYYLTVNCRNETTRHKHGISIWRAKDITGTYELLNPNQPFPPADEQFYPENPEVTQKFISNDASLFTDGDGRHFIFWSHYDGIWQAQIDLPSCRLVGEKWLAIPASTDGGDTKIEGPVLFGEGKWIYMFISSFTRDYDMGAARAEKITGPWIQQPNNPFISPHPPLTHVGHNGVFPGPYGRWWISYIMQFNGKDSPERLAIDPIWINADGWIETNAPTLGTQIIK